MIFLSIVSAQVQQSPAASESVPPLVPRVSSLDSPTLPQLSTGPRDGIRIIRRIGANYHSLGILLLKDNDGTITDAIITAHPHKPENITCDILSKWLQGQGRQPVTWATLMTVLHEIELSELAQDIASTMNT